MELARTPTKLSHTEQLSAPDHFSETIAMVTRIHFNSSGDFPSNSPTSFWDFVVVSNLRERTNKFSDEKQILGNYF